MVAEIMSTAGALKSSAIMPCDISLRVAVICDRTAVSLAPHPPAPSPTRREGEFVQNCGCPSLSLFRADTDFLRRTLGWDQYGLVVPFFFQVVPFFSQVVEHLADIGIAEDNGLQRTPTVDLPIGEEGHEAIGT